jgi:cytochrome c556
MAKRIALLAAVGLSIVGAAAAYAADQDIIAVRKAGMDLTAGNFAFIRSTVAAKGDVKALEPAGKALAAWAAVIPSVFPAGSDKGSTKALPEIWSDAAGFQKAAAAMADASTKLAEAAKAGDADGVATAAKAIGDSCGACHRGYRAK